MPSDEYVMQIKPEFDASQLDEQIGRLRAKLSGLKDKNGNSMDDLMGNIGKEDIFTRISDNVANIEQILRSVYGSKTDLTHIDSATDRRSEELKKLQDLMGNIGDMGDENKPSFLSKLAGKFNNFAGVVTKVAGGMVAAAKFIEEGVNKAIETINKTTESANKVNAFGAFGSMDTRNTMARYGMTATQAVGHQTALSALGLSDGDFGRMSPAQRQAYQKLVSTYEEGIAKIDPEKLREYFGVLEEFQMKQAEWKIKLQTKIMGLFADSESFQRLIGHVEKFFDLTLDFLDSDAVKFFMDTFIGFLDSLVTFANWFLGLFGSGSSKSDASQTTNNNTSSYNNTYYIYGGDSRDNKSLAREIIQGQQQGAVG